MRFNCAELEKFVQKIFQAGNVPAAGAKALAEVLVKTDMRGVFSHGVVRSARYLDCIRAGGIHPDAALKTIAETPASFRFDAAGGLGIPASLEAVDRLIERAKTLPIAVATINHSDHFGAAGYYALRCADAGLIGFAMSNTCPLMAPTNGATARIGNNPFAYAAPAGKKYRAVLFDICMSTVACGKIAIAAAEKKPIPFGWMLDKEGRPTDDPQWCFDGGVLLPFGGHKGYGLAMMVEILTGALGGAGMLSGVNSWNTVPGRDADTGHAFLAINPEFFGGLAEFERRMEAMIDEIVTSPKAPGCDRILYPGELEFERERRAVETGLELPEASVAELKRAAELTGLAFETEKLAFRR